jgi:hypothetical protein
MSKAQNKKKPFEYFASAGIERIHCDLWNFFFQTNKKNIKLINHETVLLKFDR